MHCPFPSGPHYFLWSHCPSVPPAAKTYYVFSSSLYLFSSVPLSLSPTTAKAYYVFSSSFYFFFKCPTVPQSHQLLKHTMCSPLLCTFFQVSHCPSVPPAAKAYYMFSSSCLLYTSPSPRDKRQSRMPSSA